MADPLWDVDDPRFVFLAGKDESISVDKINYAIMAMKTAQAEIWASAPASTQFIHLYHRSMDAKPDPILMWARNGMKTVYYSWKPLRHFYIYSRFYDSYKNS